MSASHIDHFKINICRSLLFSKISPQNSQTTHKTRRIAIFQDKKSQLEEKILQSESGLKHLESQTIYFRQNFTCLQ